MATLHYGLARLDNSMLKPPYNAVLGSLITYPSYTEILVIKALYNRAGVGRDLDVLDSLLVKTSPVI